MKQRKPNVLWLMSDQHNANCMGIAGHPDVRTPNLDSIARRGTLFSRAYCNSPICGPSRCSFLTGQYVKTHGVTGNFIRDLRHAAPNLGRLFGEHGYQTALIGKAHLPYEWIEQGFEHIRLSDLCDALSDDPSSCHYFSDLIDGGLADLYDQGGKRPGDPGYGYRSFVSELPEGFSLEAWTGRKAVEFLEQCDEENPFFLKVSFQRPHDPYSPPASRVADYDPLALQLPENACDYLEREFEGKPKFQQEHIKNNSGCGYPFAARDEKDLRVQMAAYFTLITMMDDAIGEILHTLEEKGELDNTIIVYTTDHGDFAGEHGLMLKNMGVYESIHRIPFLLAGPGVAARGESGAMIESVDFYPTIAALAGIDPENGVEGTSRLSEANGGNGGVESTVCEYEFIPPQSRVQTLRTAQYRLVTYNEMPDDGELYDCEADPGELNNLFHMPEYAAILEELKGRLDAFCRDLRRVHGWGEDAAAIEAVQGDATIRIHQGGEKWSEVQRSVEETECETEC